MAARQTDSEDSDPASLNQKTRICESWECHPMNGDSPPNASMCVSFFSGYGVGRRLAWITRPHSLPFFLLTSRIFSQSGAESLAPLFCSRTVPRSLKHLLTKRQGAEVLVQWKKLEIFAGPNPLVAPLFPSVQSLYQTCRSHNLHKMLRAFFATPLPGRPHAHFQSGTIMAEALLVCC